MHALRTFLTGNPRAAIMALLVVLCMKALVPAGYMIDSGARTFTVTLCSDDSGGTKTVEIAIPGNSAHDMGKADDAKSGGKCAFSSLSMMATGGADAVLLALAFAFILLLGLAPATRLPFGQIHYLRPPLRGPPAMA